MRKISGLAQLLTLLCVSAPVSFQQNRTPVTDPDRSTLYSWLIDHVTGQEKLVLIAPETQQTEYPQKDCLKIPADHAADFRELFADFGRRGDTKRELPRPLSASKRYAILDPNVAQEIILKSARLSQSPFIREHYPGTEMLLLFSDVYFNQKRSVALVQVDWWCGGLCGRSAWIAFEKGSDGTWQMRSWAGACLAVAERSGELHPARGNHVFKRIV